MDATTLTWMCVLVLWHLVTVIWVGRIAERVAIAHDNVIELARATKDVLGLTQLIARHVKISPGSVAAASAV